MTPKQQAFIEEYLLDLNATQAAIRAGYSPKTARQIGEENLSKPDIANEIQKRMVERMERTELTQDEVIQDLRELRDISMGRKPITVDTIVKNSRDGTAASVQMSGVVVFEPNAANRALELLGKHQGMFVDRKDVTVNNGQSYGVLLVRPVQTEEEWEAEAERDREKNEAAIARVKERMEAMK